jgi:GNAT superfamily N-acetyltransferase
MIRPTLTTETDALAAIAAGTGVFKPIEIETLKHILTDYHENGPDAGHRAVTYESEGRPIGFAYFGPTEMTDRTWHLYWIFVDRTIQAKGLGAKIMAFVEAEIRNAGGRLLIVETSGLPNYELTRKFYLKLNYKQVAVVPDFYSDGDDMVIFSKPLAGA